MKLRVWGTNLAIPLEVLRAAGMDDGLRTQCRCVVAAPTQKAAGVAFRLSPYCMRTWASETGNAREIEVATTKPGVVFFTSSEHRADAVWAELPPRAKP